MTESSLTPEQYWADKPRKRWVVPVYVYDSIRDTPRLDRFGNRRGYGSPTDKHEFYVAAATKQAAAAFAIELSKVHVLRGHRYRYAWGTRLMTPKDFC